MSHMTSIALRVKDLSALKTAAAELGVQLVEGQKTFLSYYGRQDCDHAITLRDVPAAYEIGVIKAADGDGFTMRLDTWGPGANMTAKVGENFDRLKQEYAVAVATARAKTKLKGWGVRREALAGGSVRVRLVKR